MIHRVRFAMMFMICFLSLVITGGSCDQTRLTGEVIVSDTAIRVGDTVTLQLIVPENLSEIFRVEWEVEPQASGDLFFGSQLLETLSDEELVRYFGKTKGLNPDRVALFIPKEIGRSTIYVTGFYKQTNPQPITTFNLEVVE